MKNDVTTINFDTIEINENATPTESIISTKCSSNQISFRRVAKLEFVKNYICEMKGLTPESMSFLEFYERNEGSSGTVSEFTPSESRKLNLTLIHVDKYYSMLIREGIIKNRKRYYETHYIDSHSFEVLLDHLMRIEKDKVLSSRANAEFSSGSLNGYINARKLYYILRHFLMVRLKIDEDCLYFQIIQTQKRIVFCLSKLSESCYNLDLLGEAMKICKECIQFVKKRGLPEKYLRDVYAVLGRIHTTQIGNNSKKLYNISKAKKYIQKGHILDRSSSIIRDARKSLDRKIERLGFDERNAVKGFRALKRIKYLNAMGMKDQVVDKKDQDKRLEYLMTEFVENGDIITCVNLCIDSCKKMLLMKILLT